MIRCTYCDREVPLDDLVPLDGVGEYLYLACEDLLLEELHDFTDNHESYSE